MRSITSFLALALLPAATRADTAWPVSCIFTGESSTAPFYVRFDNQHTNTVKIRMCPKQFTKCTGDPTLPNTYIDCNATLPASSTTTVFLNTGASLTCCLSYVVAVGTAYYDSHMIPFIHSLTLIGVGYIVAVANGTEATEFDPLLPGGLQWPAEIVLKK